MKEPENLIDIRGAKVHNLKNIDVKIPRDQWVVITGLSGSGKSSLAFDTLYAEGQRRYMETFSAYIRQFLGNMERPDVDKIDGLSPVIAIEQKTTSKNPRSTVGTITEIWDFFRLLYARVGTAYSYSSNKVMVKYTEQQIIDLIIETYIDKKIVILAPVIKGRKGHYRELFQSLANQGFIKVRVDGEIKDLHAGMKVDRYKIHDIEIVIDRLRVKNTEEDLKRLKDSISSAIKYGENSLLINVHNSDEIRHFSVDLICPDTGISYEIPEPNSFSFNSPKGMCSSCMGLGDEYIISPKKIIPDDTISIARGGIVPLGEEKDNWSFQQINKIAFKYDFSLKTPIKDIPKEAMNLIMKGGKMSFEHISKAMGITKTIKINYDGIENFILTQYRQKESNSVKQWALDYLTKQNCTQCNGTRLKKESLFFKIDDKNIGEIANMDLEELNSWIKKLPQVFNQNEMKIAKEILKEIESRIHFLLDVGLNYLSIGRTSKSLSGGESQRIRLATQIGSQLVGVLYILDEPSIGLHQRDNMRLIKSLEALRDIGNSIIVVEHDKDMMIRADYLIDMGPHAGKKGGEIIAQGKPEELLAGNSITAQYLLGKKTIPIPTSRRTGNKKFIELIGCTGNNLKNVTLKIPLGMMVGITGVSGSGKSTLINETLYPILNNHIYNGTKKPLPYKEIKGLKYLDKVVDINQKPIGRTPRSNPATYTAVFSEIRQLFTKTTEAQIRGYKPGRFSFNVKGGRCEECSGGGMKTIEMNFLPDIHVECEQCQGKRFNRETLEIRYKGKSISDVLNLTINQACEFFESIPKIHNKLKTIKDVGLGYITLGQSSTTLSGGEAQRIKLATELSKRDTGKTIYLLDEPTTGLHFEDIKVLLNVLNLLVSKGNTMLIIEHNLDVIKQVDYIIDIGPEGGQKGGMIVDEGVPEQIILNSANHTAKYLAKEFELA